MFFRNLGKSGLRVSCLGLGECGGPLVQCPPRKQGLWEGWARTEGGPPLGAEREQRPESGCLSVNLSVAMVTRRRGGCLREGGGQRCGLFPLFQDVSSILKSCCPSTSTMHTISVPNTHTHIPAIWQTRGQGRQTFPIFRETPLVLLPAACPWNRSHNQRFKALRPAACSGHILSPWFGGPKGGHLP